MGEINLRRVVLSGVLAGVALNVIDFVLYGHVFTTTFPIPAGTTGLFGIGLLRWFIMLDIVWGIALVYVYAAIRPRFGPGPRTAVIAGLLVWVFAGLLHALGEAPMRLEPPKLYVIGTLTGLVEWPLVTVIGARFYREGA